MNLALTRRQQVIYDLLLTQQQNFTQAPSLDELCQALGVKSRGSMHRHIQALIDARLVEPMDRKQRGVRLLPPLAGRSDHRQQHESIGLPWLGYIAAGKPIEAIPNQESIDVPAELRTNKPCFVLQVQGDSMVEDGILDGDWVVIEKRETARNGEIVVALIEGAEATLKRIEQQENLTILHPANSNMAPMRFLPEQVQIQGVLVGQMRSYQ